MKPALAPTRRPRLNLWLTAIAGGGAVILAALLLKRAHPLIVAAIFLTASGVLYVRVRRTVKPQERPQGELAGLRREAVDPFGILAYPIGLFARVSEPSIHDVVWGRWRTLDVHAFDLSFPAPGLAVPAGSTFGCAMTRVEAGLPDLVVEPQVFRTSLGPPTDPAIEVGDPGLDAVLGAWAEDEPGARALLDAPMRTWLRSLESRWGIELRGSIAIVYGPKPEGPDVQPVLDTLRAFVEHLPRDPGVPPASAV